MFPPSSSLTIKGCKQLHQLLQQADYHEWTAAYWGLVQSHSWGNFPLETLTNAQGFIPAKSQMPSSMVVSPTNGQDIAANTTFTVTMAMINIELGHFSNAKTTYYSAP